MENNTEEKKPRKKIYGVIIIVCFLLGSFFGGWILGKIMDSKPGFSAEPGEVLFILCFVMLIAYLSVFIHIVIHESGHLICGLITGYRFSSFRIGSFMFVKENGKLCLKKYSLAGTGGQCLMIPPELKDEQMPYVLYNLGGVMANIILSVVCIILSCFFRQNKYLFVSAIICALVGLVIAFLNGCPLPIKGLDSNDGNNVKNIHKSPKALKSFWLQMKIVEEISKGKLLKEMPMDWFEMPADDELENSMVATQAVLYCNRLLDDGKYAEAGKSMDELLNRKTGMVDIHRNMLINEMIYCEIVSENRTEYIEELMTPEHRRFRKSMKNSPTILRTEYLYLLYVKEEVEKAEKVLQSFNKVALKYPYAQDIKSELELIAYAKEICTERR